MIWWYQVKFAWNDHVAKMRPGLLRIGCLRHRGMRVRRGIRRGFHYRRRGSCGVVHRECLLLMSRGRRDGHRRATGQRNRLGERSELGRWTYMNGRAGAGERERTTEVNQRCRALGDVGTRIQPEVKEGRRRGTHINDIRRQPLILDITLSSI